MEVKETLKSEIPQVLERIEDVAKKIYDPQQIWLESMQFADYVTQLAQHLNEDHGRECIDDIVEQLINMSNSFKQMGENALRVLDESEKDNYGEQ
jgi:ATP-dependent phosphoenolpyruvate carboxykinase